MVSFLKKLHLGKLKINGCEDKGTERPLLYWIFELPNYTSTAMLSYEVTPKGGIFYKKYMKKVHYQFCSRCWEPDSKYYWNLFQGPIQTVHTFLMNSINAKFTKHKSQYSSHYKTGSPACERLYCQCGFHITWSITRMNHSYTKLREI